jgi:hypothetical protein
MNEARLPARCACGAEGPARPDAQAEGWTRLPGRVVGPCWRCPACAQAIAPEPRRQVISPRRQPAILFATCALAGGAGALAPVRAARRVR